MIKLGFTRVYIIFSYFCSKSIDCGYSLESPRRVPTNDVLNRKMKHIRVFYLKIFSFLEVKFSIHLNRRVFVMTPRFLNGLFTHWIWTHPLLRKGVQSKISTVDSDEPFHLDLHCLRKKPCWSAGMKGVLCRKTEHWTNILFSTDVQSLSVHCKKIR